MYQRSPQKTFLLFIPGLSVYLRAILVPTLDKIIKNNLHLAMEMRVDVRPWGLPVDAGIKLLPNESDDWHQRRRAFSLHSNLVHMAESAQKNGEPFTAETIHEFVGRYNRLETPAQQAYYERHPTVAPPKVDITLDELFATSERDLLETYRYQTRKENLPDHYDAHVDATATVNGLLEGMVSPTQTMDAPSPGQPPATPA